MNKNNQMYQISTLQALLLGYTKGVVSAGKFIEHGEIGLGTFAGVNGEMIVLDRQIYKADNEGNVTKVSDDEGIPFAAITSMRDVIEFDIEKVDSIDQLRVILTNAIEEDFGLNSMYAIRIDGRFSVVKARSESGLVAHHVELSKILKLNQKDFEFKDIEGTMVCLYFPDYMDGVNAAGWHLHFVDESRMHGGHVFDLQFEKASAKRTKVQNIQIQLPTDAEFDTYSLKTVSKDEVEKVEQSKG